MKKLRIDFSTLETFKSCPQKFVNEYILRLSPLGSGDAVALNFGDLIHFATELLGLAAVPSLPPIEECYAEIEYLSSNQPPLIDAAGQPLEQLRDKPLLIQVLHATAAYAAQKGFPLCAYNSDERRSLKHALLLLTRYAFHYYPESIKYQTFEQSVEYPLGIIDGVEVTYCGTVDGTTEDSMIERKTTSYLNSNFLERVNPSDQVTGYLWLFDKLYPEKKIRKTIFDGISTGGYGKSFGAATSQPARWTINTKPETLFLRTETYRSDQQLIDWEVRTRATISRVIATINAHQAGSLIERRAPSACTEYNSTCKFISLCRSSTQDTERDLRGVAFVRQEDWKNFKVSNE